MIHLLIFSETSRLCFLVLHCTLAHTDRALLTSYTYNSHVNKMGLMDKIKGNHAHDGTTAGTAYDKGATKHHGTTHGTNTTGAAYGEPTGQSAIPGQEPYATHGNTQHSGLPGTHGDHTSPSTTGGHHGLTGSNKHDANTLPGGAAGYGGHGQDSRAPGAYNTQEGGVGQPGAAGYGNSTTQGTGITGHHDTHSSHEKGFLGRKKDDLEESLSREQKAKAELDAAMARHNEARSHADSQLNAKEQAAQEELLAAQRRLQEAQETRRKAGH